MTVNALTRAQWLYDGVYGLSVAFIPGLVPAIPITSDLSVWRWNQICNDFDLPGFVADVAATGAGWVLLGVGQTNGFYCAPNNFYRTQTNTRIGQFCSARDLVSEVADALLAIGVYTMVYYAAEGPSGAPPNILSTFPCPSDQAPATTRASVNSMISEWSIKWGTKVRGWWFDGCFVGGYTNPTDGQANLAALIAAAQAGNPASIVACNPGSTAYRSMHPDEDFMAGEEPGIYRFPYERLVVAGGRTVQWHTLTFIGGFWSQARSNRLFGDLLGHYTDWQCSRYLEPSEYLYSSYREVEYLPEQLAAYAKNIHTLGGASTYDVAINQYGRINKKHLEVFARVKEVVRDNAPLRVFTDLARYKPTSIVSNYSPFPDLPINGEEFYHFGTYATNGIKNPSRFAQAGGEWDWALQVDLIVEKHITRAVCTFQQDRYPTNYAVWTTRDRITWTPVATNAAGGPGRFEYVFPSSLCRWVLLKANAPNGPNQPGFQMGVMGFEVYE
jgi:hypothetical protein